MPPVRSSFRRQFRRVTDGESGGVKIPSAEHLSHKEYQVVVTEPSHIVRIMGSVVFLSDNASVKDGRTVYPAAGAGAAAEAPEEESTEAAGGASAPGETPQAGQDAAGSQTPEEDPLLYIIYEQ